MVMLGGEHGDKICVNTTARTSEHYIDRNKILEQLNSTSSAVIRQGGKVAQRLKQRNKTWNQGTLAQAEHVCGVHRQHRGRGARLSIQNVDFSNHNYENVYDEDASKVTEELQNMNLISKKPAHDNNTKPNANHRQTPRSRKKSKAPIPLHRSKSCDRIGVGATLLDNLSCMSGRASPTESLYGQDQGKVIYLYSLPHYISLLFTPLYIFTYAQLYIFYLYPNIYLYSIPQYISLLSHYISLLYTPLYLFTLYPNIYLYSIPHYISLLSTPICIYTQHHTISLYSLSKYISFLYTPLTKIFLLFLIIF